MSSQEASSYKMIVVAFDAQDRADEGLDTLKQMEDMAVVAMVDFDQVDQAMEELDRFEGGKILHHKLDSDVYEKLSAAVED